MVEQVRADQSKARVEQTKTIIEDKVKAMVAG